MNPGWNIDINGEDWTREYWTREERIVYSVTRGRNRLITKYKMLSPLKLSKVKPYTVKSWKRQHYNKDLTRWHANVYTG